MGLNKQSNDDGDPPGQLDLGTLTMMMMMVNIMMIMKQIQTGHDKNYDDGEYYEYDDHETDTNRTCC